MHGGNAARVLAQVKPLQRKRPAGDVHRLLSCLLSRRPNSAVRAPVEGGSKPRAAFLLFGRRTQRQSARAEQRVPQLLFRALAGGARVGRLCPGAAAAHQAALGVVGSKDHHADAAHAPGELPLAAGAALWNVKLNLLAVKVAKRSKRLHARA